MTRPPDRVTVSSAIATIMFLTLGCSDGPTAPRIGIPNDSKPSLAFALSSYFPPPELNGGWRKTTGATKIRSLGMEPTGLAALGSYAMGLPYEGYYTGVSGYSAKNKAVLVIKNGWIVGEYYNQSSARTAVYYLASNGKTFAMMLFGRLQLDYPGLGFDLNSRLYDERWLSVGFPLTDARKSDITIDHVFRHVAGLIPEVEADVAGGAVPGFDGWDFEPFTLGHDAEYPVSAPLYFDPGNPSTYTKGSTYSSVAFNHLSPLFKQVTGLEPSRYLRAGMLDPIGVGRMAYKLPQGMGGYLWATAGNGLASARDYARLAYLLLHEGNWAGKQIFTSAWIRQFTTNPGYPNISSNAQCLFGGQYPKDLYRIVGSGVNLGFIVPSLDLVATLNGRTRTWMKDQVARTFLEKLFASVTQRYETCDGRVINGMPSPTTTQSLTGFTLINADTDQPMMALADGMTLRLADLPTRNLNVRAETSPSIVGSVRFSLDGQANYRTETSALYALAGDSGGNYSAWTPAVGAHTLTGTPYTGASGSGTAGTALTVSFSVE